MAHSASDKIPAGATEAVSRRKVPTLALVFDGKKDLAINVTGDMGRLTAASNHSAVTNGLLEQMAVLGAPEKRFDESASNFALGFVDSMAPRDAAEALLFTQMAAIHQATMTFAGRLNRVENIPQQDSAERSLNKLARTFAAQMDTLKRYRSKGQQVVRVERVTVEDGGQAIVGNVETGGEGRR